jgi:DNA processing protein
MTLNLFAPSPHVDAFARAASPRRELGAYEALWSSEHANVESLAKLFGSDPDALPSDFAMNSDIEKYAKLALGALRAAGIEDFGIRLRGAGEYPRRLLDAQHPPELLYFQGDWDRVHTPSVAIIGTRQPSEPGRAHAAALARALVADGVTVISGLARGIDTTVHTTAIAAGGRTIAVIGTPITTCYPPENRQLQARIAREHLLISQVPILRHACDDISARARFFPARNATMSALSAATIIVEAGDTSGALVQARHALAQGRKLFISEHCFQIRALRWPRHFAKLGAIRVTDYADIKPYLATPHSHDPVAD